MDHFVKPKKELGQHFLHDRNIAAKIADSIPSHEIPLLEIGPGMGMLTGYLLKRDNPLKVIEIDRESVAFLKGNFPDIESDNLISGDFLKMDIFRYFDTPFGIVGNFPYNISSQILFRMVENHENVPMLCGMFQKEVAERIAGSHGNKKYGILSVLLQTWYDVKILFTVNENAFIPPPMVKSAVVLITSKSEKPEIKNTLLYIRIVKTAFNQRRKMLKNTLKSGFGKTLAVSFANLRAEQLSIVDYMHLYNEISDQISC